MNELKHGHSRGRRLQPSERMFDNLSQQLWKQVKEERCCDVRFIFPHLAGTPSVKAQRSALIANSPVFEVQFEGNFADVSGDIPITDTEPAYLRCIFQFIFTNFEMNQKCLDDDIAQFAWEKFRKHAKN